MRRREAISLVGVGVTACQLVARTATAHTQAKMLRVGIVSPVSPRTASQWVAFDNRMRRLGYVDGQNLVVEFLPLHGELDRLGDAMRELVVRKVDVIIAFGPEAALKAAMAATNTIPIVMVAIDYDPIALGYVPGLARPTANVTGVFFQQIELSMKRLELAKQAFTGRNAATVFWDRPSADQWRAMQSASSVLGLRLAGIELRETPYDYERALSEAPDEYRGALIVTMAPLFFRDRQRLADLALRNRMASMFGTREFVEVGGLVSYGPSFAALAQRFADYVDRIAKGAKPADLPVEQPTKFEMVINLSTAKEIGVAIPTSSLLRADELIQ
jgi:putative tryptophan/tyrosine transport system substrate-binding protein